MMDEVVKFASASSTVLGSLDALTSQLYTYRRGFCGYGLQCVTSLVDTLSLNHLVAQDGNGMWVPDPVETEAKRH